MKLILGSEQLGGVDWGQYSIKECQKAFLQAIDMGIKKIDTANIYGLGTAESDPGASVFEMAKDRAIGLGGGALIGGATGGVLNPAIAGATKGIGALNQGMKKIMGGTDPNKNPALVKDVNRSIAKRLNEESSDDIARVVDDTTSPTVLADVGENTRFLGYGTQGISNPSRSGVAKSLNERNNEQSTRILDLVKKTTGISDDRLGYEFIDSLDDQVQRLAKPQYDEAYKVSIPAEKFRSLFGSTKVDAIVEASREGLRASRRQGYDVPDLTKMFKVGKNGTASFDEVMMKNTILKSTINKEIVIPKILRTERLSNIN